MDRLFIFAFTARLNIVTRFFFPRTRTCQRCSKWHPASALRRRSIPNPHVLMPLELCNASARRLLIATLIHAARFDGRRLFIAKRRQSATARQSRQSLGYRLTGYLPRDLLGCRPRKQNHLTDFIFLVRLLLSRSKINFRMFSQQLVSHPYPHSSHSRR